MGLIKTCQHIVLDKCMTTEISLGDPPKAVNVVLASNSPRRHTLIKVLDLEVAIQPPTGLETPPHWLERPEEYVSRLSLEKARDVSCQIPNAVIIGADTVVAMNNDIFCKPTDKEDAKTMLQKLCGASHMVFTGVTVLNGRSGIVKSSVTRTKVYMKRFSEHEIDFYIDTNLPFDKAGAYGIQDTEFNPVTRIEGCYLNVVGFPLCEVIFLIKGLGVNASVKENWIPPEQCRNCVLTRLEDN